MQQLVGVPRGAGRSAQDADHQRRVVPGQLGQRVRAVVGHLQEQRPLLSGDPGQGAGDRVVDERADLTARQAGRRVGVEDLEEMPDAQRGGLLPERAIGLQRGQVVVQLVVEGHRVQHQIAERADGGQVGRAERPRRKGGVAAAPAVPDVRAVVPPHGQRHVAGHQ